jgi:hypothetical protein
MAQANLGGEDNYIHKFIATLGTATAKFAKT